MLGGDLGEGGPVCWRETEGQRERGTRFYLKLLNSYMFVTIGERHGACSREGKGKSKLLERRVFFGFLIPFSPIALRGQLVCR